jgi:hypothetical protein
MRHWPRLLSLSSTLAVLAVLVGGRTAPAQEGGNAGKKMRFTTVDGVEISCTWRPGGKDKATVMLLHALAVDKNTKGEDSHKKGWDNLAKALADKGHAVLSFDFRGHGDSTTVDPKVFWAPLFRNRTFVRPSNNPNQLLFKQIPATFYNSLVNDIAAAKAFLDRRNDAGECNSSNLVLIGAETGATLGAIWMNSEWQRWELFPQGVGLQPTAAKTPEGKNIIGCLWLSINTKLGERTVNPVQTLAIASLKNATPTIFMYSEDQKGDKKIAREFEAAVKPLQAQDASKYEVLAAVPVKGAEQRRGRELLATQALGVENYIFAWLPKIVEVKANEYVARDFQKSQFVWNLNGTLIPAKRPGDTTFLYNDYSIFAASR